MQIKGSILDIIYRNEQNSYTVLSVEVDKKRTTVVGTFPDVHIGLSIEAEGEFKTTKYGEQFVAVEAKVIEPKSAMAIEKYLASGLIKGIGQVTAARIVEAFGEDTLDVLNYNPMKLASIKGISRAKAAEIGNSYSELKVMQNSIMFLQEYGITVNMSIKIYNIYKNETIDVVKNNPYRLVDDIDGVGFLTADNIAQKIGIEPCSENRVRAGILHILKMAVEEQGNTYLKVSEILQTTDKLLGFSGTENELIEKVLGYLAIENNVKIFTFHGEEIAVLTKYYYYESYIAKKLIKLSRNIFESVIDHNKNLEFYQKVFHISLNDEQKQAVLKSINNGVTVITGGPGTGKTTIVKCILTMLEEEHKNTLLLAPTGRAAKRLQESSGKEAKTIHRALEMLTGSNGVTMFNRNESNPINADVIIVDEMSMVDIVIFYHLLKATKSTCKLILVGDKDQLPSVSAGNVLKDIISSGVINTISLKQIYRQESNSLIITNAHMVNEGKMPIIDNNSKDFFFRINNDVESSCEEIVDLVSTRLPNYFKIKPEEIQVLAPMKSGPCGTNNLNRRLQMVLNPNFKGVQILDDFVKYRVGDKVMQIQNNYDIEYEKYEENGMKLVGNGVYNGDIGYITHINPQTYETTVTFDDGKIVEYPKQDLSQITLAYAITIHKSQGSEFDVIVIPVVAGAPIIITRNLLYTAITRAKKAVVLIGAKKNLSRMIYNNYTTMRYTLLQHFLKEEENKFSI